MERYARARRGRLTVVGLGTRNTIDDATSFVARHDMRTTRMLWDESSRSWAALEVTVQPVTLVLDPSGRRLLRVLGAFDGPAVDRAILRSASG